MVLDTKEATYEEKPSYALVCSVVAGLRFSSWASLSTGVEAATGKTSNAPATDPRLDMVTALQAMGPHPSLGDQAKVFGRFVGTWDAEYPEFSKDGKATRSPCEIVFGWIMERLAIQNLFIV